MPRPSRTAQWVCEWALASLACATCLASVALAEDLPLQVASDACPGAALLEQRLAPLLPGRTLITGEEPAPTAVRDLGERYAIDVAGLTREVDDPLRDCTERARVAAVFIALNLGPKPPPEASKPKPDPDPDPDPDPESESESESESDSDSDSDSDFDEVSFDPPRGRRLGLRLMADAAYSPALDRVVPGGSAGAFIGDGSLGFALTVGALVPARVSLAPEDGAVSLLRLPIVASGELSLRFGAIELGPVLGFALDVMRLQGVEVMRAQSAWRVNPGVLLAADVALNLSRVAALRLRGHATAFARAYDLNVEPIGSVRRAPRLWLGASLGLDIRLR